MSSAGKLRPATLAMATLVVGAPVVFDPWGWAAFGPAKWAVVTTAALVVVALVVAERSVELHLGSAVGWALFLIWGVVASVFALDPLYTWLGTPDRHLGLAGWVLFGLMFVAGQTVRSHESVRILLRAAVVALAGIGIYVVLELLGMAPVELAIPSSRAGGPFGTPAYLGAACALLVPVAVGAAVDGLGARAWRVAAVLAVGLGLVAALASQTRAGWVGLAAAVIVALPAAWGALRDRRWVVAVSAAVAVGVFVLTPVGGRVISAFDFEDGTARGRLDEWQVGVTVLANHPLGGVGFEGYRIAFSEGVDADYEQRYTRQVMPDRTHSGALDVGVTTGAPGMLVYLTAMTWLTWLAVLAVRRREPWLAGLAAGIVGYLVQQQFLFPVAEVDPVFWLFAGVLVAATSTGRRVNLPFPRWLWLIPLSLASAALVAGTLDIAADHRTRNALDATSVGDHVAALVAADDAVALRPDSIRYGFIAATVAAGPKTVDGHAAALARLDAALDLSPSDPILRAEHASVRLERARLARDPAELGAALAEWEALVADDPHHARYRLELGVAHAVSGDDTSAEDSWLAAADLAPRSTAPLTNLAVLYLETGRLQDAAAMIEAVRLIDPEAVVLSELETRLGATE